MKSLHVEIPPELRDFLGSEEEATHEVHQLHRRHRGLRLRRRNQRAAARFSRRLLKGQGRELR